MRCLAVLALAAAALAVGVASAGATNECRGLQVCVPVAGPWVVVPAGVAVPRAHVEYQLSCPRGYVVGGLDAELTDPAIDLTFLGTLGSPVTPGITTSRDAVFGAAYVGGAPHGPSFRPHIGCMPANGGGGRVPTSATVPPGKPTVRRVRTVSLHAGRSRVVQGCAAGERLVGASYALGFQTTAPPTARQIAGLTATQAVSGGRVTVSVRAGATLRDAQPLVQVDAICAGGR